MSLHAFDKIPRSPDQSNESGLSFALQSFMGDVKGAYAGMIGGNVEDSLPKATVTKTAIEFAASK